MASSDIVLVPTDGNVDVRVMDAQGRLIYNEEQTAKQGVNRLTLTNEEVPAAGMYFVELAFGSKVVQTKMIIVE